MCCGVYMRATCKYLQYVCRFVICPQCACARVRSCMCEREAKQYLRTCLPLLLWEPWVRQGLPRLHSRGGGLWRAASVNPLIICAINSHLRDLATQSTPQCLSQMAWRRRPGSCILILAWHRPQKTMLRCCFFCWFFALVFTDIVSYFKGTVQPKDENSVSIYHPHGDGKSSEASQNVSRASQQNNILRNKWWWTYFYKVKQTAGEKA